MGDNKCAYDSCNALEFRTSGYCLKHKDGPKTTLISEINPIKSETLEEFDMVETPKEKYNTTVWFLAGFFVGPIFAIIMGALSEVLLTVNEGFAGFTMCIILPAVYIIGIVWGFRSNGPTGFALGLLVMPIIFGLFVLWIFYIASTEGLFM